MRVALCQCNSMVGNASFDPRRQNLEEALDKVGRATSRGAELVVFGEGFLTGYGTGDFLPKYALALNPAGEYLRDLLDVAREKNIHVVIGATTRQRGKLYNTALLLGPSGILGVYNKTHLFTGPCQGMTVDERSWWTPGSEIPVYDTPLGKIGLEVCYDITYPEVSRVLRLKGADLIVNLAAEFEGYQRFWNIIPRARALENQTWHLVCSVVGKQGKLRIFGGTRIVDPRGREVARAKDGEVAVLIADIEYRENLKERRELELADARRPRLYGVLTEQD